MHKFVIVFLLISKVVFSQTEISWETLSDVEFSEIYLKEEDAYVLYPHFGLSIMELAFMGLMWYRVNLRFIISLKRTNR